MVGRQPSSPFGWVDFSTQLVATRFAFRGVEVVIAFGSGFMSRDEFLTLEWDLFLGYGSQL